MKKIYPIIISIIMLLMTNAHAADVKVSALTEATLVTADDLLMLVDDPAGTPVSKKISITNFLTGGGTLAIGQIFVWNGKLEPINPGTDGFFLKSRGPGALPEYAAVTAINYPSAGITISTGSAWDTPATYSDIVGLFGSGSCSGYLKHDGSCDTSSSTWAGGTVTSSILPNAAGTLDLGSGTYYFDTIYASTFQSSCTDGNCVWNMSDNPSGFTPGAGAYGFGFDNGAFKYYENGTKKIPQTVKVEKLAVFNIPGDSADNTVVDAYVPVASTITGVLITTTGAACSAGVDIWADTYANFPATVADAITASAKPTLSTAQKNKDTTLTGWTTAIPADSVLRANLDSSDCTGLIQVTLFGTK